ncbi:hypothetical protein FNO01nite_29460 [Flavobacterium noncentrifugens]|uniref:Uncharacterized protein n=1 Tax=Flavobacterium noncentrifugens TaxID=1128970 RepID=A0A1G8Y3G9_9FLAO|nr:hypothetical protein [Flavobacterium noncentrifugens]GEP52274.1 hypothetical protein FNO01nite_29460 [Flavobacterium noncentrifugens]SDJ96665.1 hypothetical protein SAMN04487935_2154 [Flavobacterium noncentrifugens]
MENFATIALGISVLIILYVLLSIISDYHRRKVARRIINNQFTRMNGHYLEENESFDVSNKVFYHNQQYLAHDLDLISISDIEIDFKVEFVISQYKKIEKEFQKTTRQ